MEGNLVLNLDKVRQGVAIGEGELLHRAQMDLLLDKIRQIMASVADFRRQFDHRQPSISHRRHHDAILLSGARGTGKTTFLLSALHKLQGEKLDDNYSFCVFEPVDPTLFGYNEHILFTLLSMIAKEVCSCRDHCETSRYCHSGGAGDWESWEKQLMDLAKGLQTVGEQREDIDSRPSLKKNVWENPEYLLEEGIEKARSSYELEYKLHGFINTSLKLLHKDAFVLGLDDVDTRPGIGWHVLEVLRRYLTTPQIIVIVSGNMELFQKLVERQQLKNFGLDFSTNTQVLQHFDPQVTELTNQYLLKVLRIPLRIELLPFYEALEQAFLTRKNQEGSPNIDIDSYCVIELHGKQVALADILKIFYDALSCGRPSLQAAFRKALLANSARTVLQIVERLIGEEGGTPQAKNRIALSRHVAEILRIAFFDYLVASGIAQPQEYFGRLREGVGLEKITRLLLTDKLPGDVSLRPVHGDLRVDNSLLALASGLTAATAGNCSIFFLYFFKVCFALQILDGRQAEDINALLGETSLTAFAFRCSSHLHGDPRRSGWRAPGVLGVYGASAKKNIPECVRSIYGESIIELLKENTPELLLKDQKELLPFLQEMCNDALLSKKRGNVILNGYFIIIYDSLQDDIKSWHQALVPHGFYEIVVQGSTYSFFSFWGLLGLMTEILTCATEEDIFNIFSRNARPVRLAYHDDASAPSPNKRPDDASMGDTEDTESSDASANDSAQEIADDAQSVDNLSDGTGSKLKLFIQRLMKWKKTYADQAPLCFLPPVLCERVFRRFLHGMERLDDINSGEIFLGNYIHKSLVILFNSLLVEEYIACHDNVDGLDLKTPLSSDDIFMRNFRKVAELEQIEVKNDLKKLPPAKYPLTRLVMACPLWSFYVKPDDQTSESISDMLQCFWPEYIDQMDPVIYLDKKYQFDNLYYLYNALAIRRKIGKIDLDIDLRTDLGKQVNVPKNPPKIILKTLVDAFKQAIVENKLTKRKLVELNDGTENFAKKAFNLLYIISPSTDQLWSEATTSTKNRLLKTLRDMLGTDKTEKA